MKFFLKTVLLCVMATVVTAQTMMPEFQSGPSMNINRMGHLAALLNDNTLVLIGGHGTGFASLATAEIFNPVTGQFTTVNMNATHDGSALVKLPAGPFLIAGGAADWGVAPGNNSVEVLDFNTGQFSSGYSMTYGRMNCSAAVLDDYHALIVGGWYNYDSPTYPEIYDYSHYATYVAGALNTPRSNPITVSTGNGDAVVFGGSPAYGGTLYESAEYYHAAGDSFFVLTDYLFGPDDTGWQPFLFSSYTKDISLQQLSDGRYVFMAYRSSADTIQYTLFTFDPATLDFEKVQTNPALPLYSSHYYFAPIVDAARNVVYIPAVKNGTDPWELTLFAVDMNQGTLLMPDTYHNLGSGYYLDYANWYLLPDGRIFCSGGHSETGYNTNFSPVNFTLFITPNYTPVAINKQTMPERFELSLSSYPNPFNSQITFLVDLPGEDRLSLEMYNSLGQRVSVLGPKLYAPGKHAIRWNSGELSSGIYMVRVLTSAQQKVQKVVLIK